MRRARRTRPALREMLHALATLVPLLGGLICASYGNVDGAAAFSLVLLLQYAMR